MFGFVGKSVSSLVPIELLDEEINIPKSGHEVFRVLSFPQLDITKAIKNSKKRFAELILEDAKHILSGKKIIQEVLKSQLQALHMDDTPAILNGVFDLAKIQFGYSETDKLFSAIRFHSDTRVLYKKIRQEVANRLSEVKPSTLDLAAALGERLSYTGAVSKYRNKVGDIYRSKINSISPKEDPEVYLQSIQEAVPDFVPYVERIRHFLILFSRNSKSRSLGSNQLIYKILERHLEYWIDKESYLMFIKEKLLKASYSDNQLLSIVAKNLNMAVIEQMEYHGTIDVYNSKKLLVRVESLKSSDRLQNRVRSETEAFKLCFKRHLERIASAERNDILAKFENKLDSLNSNDLSQRKLLDIAEKLLLSRKNAPEICFYKKNRECDPGYKQVDRKNNPLPKIEGLMSHLFQYLCQSAQVYPVYQKDWGDTVPNPGRNPCSGALSKQLDGFIDKESLERFSIHDLLESGKLTKRDIADFIERKVFSPQDIASLLRAKTISIKDIEGFHSKKEISQSSLLELYNEGVFSNEEMRALLPNMETLPRQAKQEIQNCTNSLNIKVRHLVRLGLGSFMAALILFREDDNHTRNYGISRDEYGKFQVVKIDYDMSVWPYTSKIKGLRTGSRIFDLRSPGDRFKPLDTIDFKKFPDVHFIYPSYWPTRVPKHNLMERFRDYFKPRDKAEFISLGHDDNQDDLVGTREHFRQNFYKAALIFLLFSDDTFDKAVDLYFGKLPNDKRKLTSIEAKYQKGLRQELKRSHKEFHAAFISGISAINSFKPPESDFFEFRHFVLRNPEIYKEVKDHIRRVNKSSKLDLVNLRDLDEKFKSLNTDLDEAELKWRLSLATPYFYRIVSEKLSPVCENFKFDEGLHKLKKQLIDNYQNIFLATDKDKLLKDCREKIRENLIKYLSNYQETEYEVGELVDSLMETPQGENIYEQVFFQLHSSANKLEKCLLNSSYSLPSEEGRLSSKQKKKQFLQDTEFAVRDILGKKPVKNSFIYSFQKFEEELLEFINKVDQYIADSIEASKQSMKEKNPALERSSIGGQVNSCAIDLNEHIVQDYFNVHVYYESWASEWSEVRSILLKFIKGIPTSDFSAILGDQEVKSFSEIQASRHMAKYIYKALNAMSKDALETLVNATLSEYRFFHKSRTRTKHIQLDGFFSKKENQDKTVLELFYKLVFNDQGNIFVPMLLNNFVGLIKREWQEGNAKYSIEDGEVLNHIFCEVKNHVDHDVYLSNYSVKDSRATIVHHLKIIYKNNTNILSADEKNTAESVEKILPYLISLRKYLMDMPFEHFEYLIDRALVHYVQEKSGLSGIYKTFTRTKDKDIPEKITAYKKACATTGQHPSSWKFFRKEIVNGEGRIFRMLVLHQVLQDKKSLEAKINNFTYDELLEKLKIKDQGLTNYFENYITEKIEDIVKDKENAIRNDAVGILYSTPEGEVNSKIQVMKARYIELERNLKEKVNNIVGDDYLCGKELFAQYFEVTKVIKEFFSENDAQKQLNDIERERNKLYQSYVSNVPMDIDEVQDLLEKMQACWQGDEDIAMTGFSSKSSSITGSIFNPVKSNLSSSISEKRSISSDTFDFDDLEIDDYEEEGFLTKSSALH